MVRWNGTDGVDYFSSRICLLQDSIEKDYHDNENKTFARYFPHIESFDDAGLLVEKALQIHPVRGQLLALWRQFIDLTFQLLVFFANNRGECWAMVLQQLVELAQLFLQETILDSTSSLRRSPHLSFKKLCILCIWTLLQLNDLHAEFVIFLLKLL